MKISGTRPVTRRTLLGLSISCAATVMLVSGISHGSSEERADLKAVFDEQHVVGTFVLIDVAADKVTLVNPKRAETRFIPASTFKIANSLIALEAGVVKDENEIIPYGGKPQLFKAWEKDMSMRDALAASAVPIYQELARRIGIDRYQTWLARLDFGNRQTGTIVDQFWLDGPLEISALEEARFVALLAQHKLDISARSQSIVRDIMRIENRDGIALYAKTGWLFSSDPKIGWWTGWVEREGKIFAFSLNIDMRSADDAPKRIAIGKALLAKLGVL